LSHRSAGDQARGEWGEFTARTISVRSAAHRTNIGGPRGAELPFLPSFNLNIRALHRVSRRQRDFLEYEGLRRSAT